MKNLLAWVKANLLIVVFLAVIVISLPAAFFGASWWGGNVRKTRAENVSKRLTDVQNAKMKYSLAPIMPGGTGVDESIPANLELNKYFAAERAKAEKAASGVMQTALDFNQGKGPMAAAAGRTAHVPLVDGLFPKPAAGASVTELTNRFVDRIATNKDRPSVYTQMLREILNAGEPVDMAVLGKQLDAERASQLQRLAGTGGAKLDEAAQRQLDQSLLELRRRAHMSRASEISVYASIDALPIEGATQGERGGSTIPRTIPETPPAVSRAFQWQMDYWMIRDLLSAVRVANTSSGGTPTNVNNSLVKRIERITLGDPFGVQPPNPAGDSGDGSSAGPTPATTLEALAGLVPTDPLISVTGRKSSPGNPLYDVRTAELVLIVDSTRIKELMDAFARTNFMTILDIDLVQADVRGDLERGFYYGASPVIKATIVVETVWLRGWTEALFPSGVRRNLGLPLAEGEKSDHAEMAGGSGGSGGYDPSMDTGGGGGEEPVSSKGRGGG